MRSDEQTYFEDGRPKRLILACVPLEVNQDEKEVQVSSAVVYAPIA